MVKAPQNLQDLLQRCQQITGKNIGHLAAELNLATPADLQQAKGWQGQLIEAYLGATAGSQALPDFPDLGIELKTIPIDANYKPLESTYVCTVQTNEATLQWRESWTYNKLKQVLWIPVLSSKAIPLVQRIICQPILWAMDPASEEVLRTDWEELMELMQLGYGKSISATYGTALHIRPKAANNKILVPYIDYYGNPTKIVPKGFYLRPQFTAQILRSYTQN